jgi:hypothetical protein
MKEKFFTASEILAILDKEWDRCYEMADLGIITKKEAYTKSSGVLCAAKALGLGDEFNNYGVEPQPDAEAKL